MLYPNARYMTLTRNRAFGPAPGLDTLTRNKGDRHNRFINCCAIVARTASTPDGYGMKTPFPPIRTGSIATRQAVLDLAMTGALVSGGLMGGTTTLELTHGGDLGLVVALVGTATMAMDGDNLVLTAVSQMTADGTMSLGDDCNLGLIVPMIGDGELSLSGSSDLRGLLSMTGTWDEVAGELTAAAVAGAVWEHQEAQRLLTIGVGDITGAGTGTEEFTYGVSTCVVTVDIDGNRTMEWA